METWNKKREGTMEQFAEEFPHLIDLSCVRACHSKEELDRMVDLAREISCAAVFAMPSYIPYVKERMGESHVRIGGVISFPSGGQTTKMKVQQAEELMELGCTELDMVINQTALCFQWDEQVQEDVAAVVRIAGKIPVKVILEVNNLTEEEIIRGCRLAAAGGASFVKSGTGWHAKPTTVQQIQLMRDASPDWMQIKAAGGISSVETACQMYQIGCRRFGLGIHTAETLLHEFQKMRIK